jgi:hypothetical protein
MGPIGRNEIISVHTASKSKEASDIQGLCWF